MRSKQRKLGSFFFNAMPYFCLKISLTIFFCVNGNYLLQALEKFHKAALLLTTFIIITGKSWTDYAKTNNLATARYYEHFFSIHTKAKIPVIV